MPRFSFSTASTLPGAEAGPQARFFANPGGAAPESTTLAVVVLLEALAYVALRHFFRHSHGG